MPVSFHGASKYANDRCRCDVCRIENSRRVQRQKQRRQVFLVDGADGRPVTTADVPHGRASTYGNWGCRCPSCSDAYSVQNRLAHERWMRRLRRAQRGA